MERFSGQEVGERPHLAVLFADKLGGFVAATPLLRGLKEKYPGAVLDYFGGDPTAELESACRFIDSRFSLYGAGDPLRRVVAYVAEREAVAGPYALAINLDANPANALVTTLLRPRYVVGRCFSADLRRELPFLDDEVDGLQREFWSDPSLLARYRGTLSSTFIGEIFCRLARVETDFFRTEVPTVEPSIRVPDVLIATGATRSAKLWLPEYWEELVGRLIGRGLSVGLLGGPPSAQRLLYGSAEVEERLLSQYPLVDLRGKLTLPQVAGALARARACLTVDCGIVHLAYSVGTPTVAIFGSSPWRVWAPKLTNLAIVLPSTPCSLCEDRRFANDACLRDRQVCMESTTPDSMLARMDELLERQPVAHRI